MTFDPGKHHRRSVRLPSYDYAQAGVYFLTLCSYNREPIFGEIIDAEIELSTMGRIVEEEWRKTGEIRSQVSLDVFLVMPNHLHALLVILPSEGRGTPVACPNVTPQRRFGSSESGSLSSILSQFKSVVSKRINLIRGTPAAPVWQSNYYERVVRSEEELDSLREYIVNNPLKRDLDPDNTVPSHAYG